MIWRTLGAAFRGSFTRWRVSLVVLAIIGLPLALPSVAVHVLTRIMMRGADADPVLAQHAMWIMASPEVIAAAYAVVALLLGPWVIGIWGASDRTQVCLWIGWEAYVRYLVILCAVGVVLILDGVLGGLLGVGFQISLILEVLFDGAALYVFLRLAPAGPVIRDGGKLDLPGAWRGTGPRWRGLLVLAALWVVLGLVMSILGEFLSLGLSLIIGATESAGVIHLLLLLGSPGLITGLVAACIALLTIALFWAVAEEARPQP